MSLENTQGIGGVATAIWLASSGWRFNSIKQMWQNPLDSGYHTAEEACGILIRDEREEEKYKPITCPHCEPVHIKEPHIGEDRFGAVVCGCHCHREQIELWS